MLRLTLRLQEKEDRHERECVCNGKECEGQRQQGAVCVFDVEPELADHAGKRCAASATTCRSLKEAWKVKTSGSTPHQQNCGAKALGDEGAEGSAIVSSLRSHRNPLMEDGKSCTSPKEFFRRLMKDEAPTTKSETY